MLVVGPGLGVGVVGRVGIGVVVGSGYGTSLTSLPLQGSEWAVLSLWEVVWGVVVVGYGMSEEDL